MNQELQEEDFVESKNIYQVDTSQWDSMMFCQKEENFLLQYHKAQY